jgi:phage anti-repressor protein
MNELITINYETDRPTISGRELHTALKVATAYKDWFPRMCEYGFTEGTDFSSNLSKSTGGRPSADHTLTIAMAKEICMLQRSETGKKFREYFISIEEAWNCPEKIMERALQIAHQRAIEAERRVFSLSVENETLEIALNTSLQFYTVAKYNKRFNNGKWTMKQCQDIGKNLTAYCRSHAIEIRKCETNDERFDRTNSYPLTAWEEFLKRRNAL